MPRLVGLIASIVIAQLSLGVAFAAEQRPVTFGALYGLTGGWSAYGVPSSRGARMFVDQANAKGGVLGRPIRLILEDVESSAERAADLVDTILSEGPNVAAIFGLADTDLARAAAQAASAAGVVFVTSGATSPRLPAEVPTYLFLACFGDNVQAAAAAQFAFSNLAARSVSIVYDDTHTYTRILHGYFQSSFETLGGVVRSVVALEGPDNLGAAIGGIVEADIIFLAAESPPDALRMVKALRAEGFDQPIIGGDGYDGETTWREDPSLKDIYFSTHGYFGGDHPSALNAKFRRDYMAEYGGVEPGSFAGLGYDTVGLLAAAVEKAGSDAPEKMLEALSTIQDFEGVTGTISFIDGSLIPLKSVTILEIADGKRNFVEQFLPKNVPSPSCVEAVERRGKNLRDRGLGREHHHDLILET